MLKYYTLLILLFSTTALTANSQAVMCDSERYKIEVNPDGYTHNKYVPYMSGVNYTEYLGGGYIAYINKHDDRKTPLWVSYQINHYKSHRGSNHAPSRIKYFPWPIIKDLYNAEKPQLTFDITYLNAPEEWVVGLLAPRGDMSRISEAYGCNAYVFANAAPFNKMLYKGIWKGLENYASSLSNQVGKIWVTTGPIYSDKETEYIGNPDNNEKLIGIPDKYFKVIMYETKTHIRILSFIYPNKNIEQKTYLSGSCQDDMVYDHSPYIVSLSEIEQATGLLFFPDIEVDITDIKQQKAPGLPAIDYRFKVGYCM